MELPGQSKELTTQEKIDVLVRMGKYKQAARIAAEIEKTIEIIDDRGTMYRVSSEGSIRRLVPKRRKRK
jgi:hypothetical protein